LSVAVFAADSDLRNDHPDTYVVQKGDTLWDIAGRFLNHPWLWPEIWQANPQVQNPHLIYPGDVLSLVYLDGRPIVGVQGGFGPRVRREGDEAINTIPLSRVEPFLQKMRMLSSEEAATLPYVLALEEDRLRGAEGQLAYVRGLDAPVGTRVTVLRPMHVYYDVPDHYSWGNNVEKHTEAYEWSNERGHTLTGFWDSISAEHWKHRKSDYLGHEAMEIAQGEVLRGGDPTTILVQYGDQEIKESDLVVVGGVQPFDLTFTPRPPPEVPANMRVVAFTDALNAVGPNQVVALSRGAADGVENGHVFSIFHPGEVVRDDTAYADDDVRTVFNKSKADVQLPEEFVGHVMIFRTFDRLSYGLVMEGIRPVHLYDTLHPPAK